MREHETAAIPIRNLYALLMYAWDHLDIADENSVGVLEAQTPQELLARILSHGILHLLRRGAYREYRQHTDELRHPRGKFAVTQSLARGLRARGALECIFDELVYDVPQNQVLKAAVKVLLRCKLAPNLLGPLRSAYLLLNGITDVAFTERLLLSVETPRGHRLYRLLLDVCWLLLRTMLPTEDGHGYRLRDFTRHDKQMAYLFESFVANFLARECTSVEVKKQARVSWVGAHGTDSALALLPRMITDVTHVSSGRRSILETKFVRQPFRTFETNDRLKLRSAHLYQLFAYLKNIRQRVSAEEMVDGVLVYASVGRGVSERIRLHDVVIAVRTIDLSVEWPALRRQLLELPTASLTE